MSDPVYLNEEEIQKEPALEPVEQDPAILIEEDQPRRFPLVWVILAVLVLAGAAYLGARLLNAQQGGAPLMAFGPGGTGATTRRSIRLDMDRAPELPTRKSDKAGLLTEIKDKSLMLTSGGNIAISVDENGEVSATTDQSLPPIEVVVTEDTQIYQDVTFVDGPPREGEKVQQKVEPVEFSALEKNSVISVWGTPRGDRLIADVIVYSRPVSLRRGQ